MNANWYSEVPVVTRTYMTMAFMTTLACSLDIITPLSLYLNTNLIYTKYQVQHSQPPPAATVRSCANCSLRSSPTTGVAPRDEFLVFRELRDRLSVPSILPVPLRSVA